MTFMLLAGSSSAWAWTVIYDNSETKWTEVYLYVGKGDWSECNLKMTEYDTNLFFFNGSGWGDATEIAFGNADLGGSTSGNICSKLKTTSSSTYNYGKDFSKTYKYKATGLTSADKDCSNKQRYYWPDTNARVEVSNFSIKKIQLAGDFNNWGSSTDICYSQSGSTCSFEKELSAKSKYEFKIIIDGTWYSQNAVTVDGSKVTFKNPWDANSSFKASKDGIYTFNIDKDKKVWITYRTACTTPDVPSIKINNESTVTLCEGSATITTTAVTGATSYSLYKGSATTASQTNTTGTFTVSEADTYYVTVTTCAESPKQTTGVTLSYYSAPTLTNKYSITNATKCNNTPNNDGAISIQNGVDGVTYSLNDDEGTSWSGLAKGTYTLKATLDACNKLSDTKTVEVGETDKTPAINNISIKEVSAVCKGEDLTLQLNEAVQDGVTYTWYKSNTSSSSIGTGTSLALTDLQETSTYILVASKTENGCTATKEASIEVTVNAIPDAPDAITFGPVCGGVDFTLPEIEGNWYAEEEGGEPIARDIAGITTQTTYFASAINEGCESVDRTALVVNVKNKPAVPTLTAENDVTAIIAGKTTTTLIVGNVEQDATYTLYKDGVETPETGHEFTISEGGKYKVVASNSNGCGTSESEEIEITICTPISNIRWRITSIAEDVYCSGEEVQVTLNYDGDTATGIEWNLNGVTVSNNENETASGTVYTMIVNQSGSAQLTLIGCDGLAYPTTPMQFSVSSETVAPTIGISKNSICEGEGAQTITVNGYNPNYTYALYKDGVKQNTTISNTGTFTVNTTGEYTVTAKNCVESTPSNSVSLTVNPLPTITGISVNNSTPVINEDVLLTVEGGDIARVEWSITPENNASLSDASGNSVKLTSTTSGTVTVTATATSGAGCTTTSTKEVTFKAVENCDPITDNTKIEIWCQVTGTTTPYCHAYNIKSPNNVGFAQWPGLTHTSKNGDYYIWTLDKTNGLDIDNNKVGIVFSKNSSGNNQTADITTFYVGNRYYFTYNANSNDKNNNYTKGNSEPLTTYPPLSAPAVKTVSATSEEGSGIVTFTGKVLKTGCANGDAIWVGYQYKKANEEWPTTGVTAGSGEKQLVTITNNPGSEDFTANVEGLEDVDYHFRAYIINGYDFTNGNYDQGVYYGLDKLVTVSTVQTAVKTAEIELVNQDGTSKVEPGHKYCVGETGYIKVTSDVKYSTATWKSDLGVEVEQIGKTNIYQFEVKGKDQIVVLLSNKHNTEPVSSEPLEVDVYASPSVPEIALGASSICDTSEDGTTLTVTRTKAGQYYALYKEDGNGGIEVEDYQYCTSDNAEIEYTGLKEAAKYFVKTYRGECDSEITRSSSATLTVVDSKDVKISIEPITTETTPWMPAKLTVTATSDFTVTSVPNDAVINISGNLVKVKLPLPEGANNVGTTDNNVNVTFTPVRYTITAELKTAGEEGNPCAEPTTATVRLVPYTEVCQ